MFQTTNQNYNYNQQFHFLVLDEEIATSSLGSTRRPCSAAIRRMLRNFCRSKSLPKRGRTTGVGGGSLRCDTYRCIDLFSVLVDDSLVFHSPMQKFTPVGQLHVLCNYHNSGRLSPSEPPQGAPFARNKCKSLALWIHRVDNCQGIPRPIWWAIKIMCRPIVQLAVHPINHL